MDTDTRQHLWNIWQRIITYGHPYDVRAAAVFANTSTTYPYGSNEWVSTAVWRYNQGGASWTG